ncbi:hypothetical protein DEFDS_2133 [Deferribacter desulfuricans SSM1]|uniref:histidine kinase n=2 Tax=Deferribacter TaxID=53572 RepID=D3PA40_DEFDS|nr:hypothetical protein DEFDS_2133 [Deferribacter desulfuricans SSM1]
MQKQCIKFIMLKKVIIAGFIIFSFFTISFIIILQLQNKEFLLLKETNEKYTETLLSEINNKIEQNIENKLEKLKILSNFIKNNPNNISTYINNIFKDDTNSIIMMISNEGNILTTYPKTLGFNGLSILNFPDIADFFIKLSKENELAKFLKIKMFNNETLTFTTKNYICIGTENIISNNNKFYLLQFSPLSIFFQNITDKFEKVLGKEAVIFLGNKPEGNNFSQIIPFEVKGLKYYIGIKDVKPPLINNLKKHFSKINLLIFILLSITFIFGAYIVYELFISHRRLEKLVEKRVNELNLERKKYETFFKNLPLPAIVFDPIALTIVDLNSKATEYGFKKDDKLTDLLKNEKILENHIKTLNEKLIDDFELNVSDKYIFQIFSIFDKNENKVISIINDITENKKLYEKIKNAERKELVATITTGIAHDFKNSLSNIQLYLKLMETEPDNWKKFIEPIKTIINSSTDHINNLLLIANNKKPKLKELKIDDVMNEFLQIIKQYIPKNIDLTYINLVTDSKILGSKSSLIQAFLNIVVNSKDAIGKNKGDISIVIDKEILNNINYIKFTFSDNGPGIEKDILKNIFKPFYSTKENGCGLGLALVNRVIKELSGFMNIESEIGKGTIVRIYLPEKVDG